MTRKMVKQVIWITVILLAVILGWQHHRVATQYAHFSIEKHVIRNSSRILRLNATAKVTSVRQHMVNGDYIADVKVYAKQAKRLSVYSWYLSQGLNEQPTQFDVTINGTDSDELKAGTNHVQLKAQYNRKNKAQPHLVIIQNPARGKHIRTDFTVR